MSSEFHEEHLKEVELTHHKEATKMHEECKKQESLEMAFEENSVSLSHNDH